jgi:hypothetical protein
LGPQESLHSVEVYVLPRTLVRIRFSIEQKSYQPGRFSNLAETRGISTLRPSLNSGLKCPSDTVESETRYAITAESIDAIDDRDLNLVFTYSRGFFARSITFEPAIQAPSPNRQQSSVHTSEPDSLDYNSSILKLLRSAQGATEASRQLLEVLGSISRLDAEIVQMAAPGSSDRSVDEYQAKKRDALARADALAALITGRLASRTEYTEIDVVPANPSGETFLLGHFDPCSGIRLPSPKTGAVPSGSERSEGELALEVSEHSASVKSTEIFIQVAATAGDTRGFAYRIPVEAHLKIISNGRDVLSQRDAPIWQFGAVAKYKTTRELRQLDGGARVFTLLQPDIQRIVVRKPDASMVQF